MPKQFSWLDQRLVRDRFIERCDIEAWALYLFLVVVGDGAGLSYYSDRAIDELLSLQAENLSAARMQLIRAGLLAYQKPIYQVLSLDAPEHAEPTMATRKQSSPQVLSDIFKQAFLRRTND